MRYLIRKSIIDIVGRIWLPPIVCGQTVTLSQHDLDGCRDDRGRITRESVQHWLDTHTGDFQSVTDFHASLEDGDQTIDLPWATEDGEASFMGCLSESD